MVQTQKERVVDMNECHLIGRLGQDPDIKATKAGRTFATLSIATTRGEKDRNTGEWSNITKWTKVVCWSNDLAELIRDNFRKGDRIEVFGELEDTSWVTQDGTERHSTQVTIRPWAKDAVRVPDDSKFRAQTSTRTTTKSVGLDDGDPPF